MHDAARKWVESTRSRLSVLEIGSRNINGGVRDLFAGWNFTGIDSSPGDGVDIVADGATWGGDGRTWQVVVCCEVLEHAKNWHGIIENAFRLTEAGGLFVGTAAGPKRMPHKCNGEAMPDPPDEHYQNIRPEELRMQLSAVGFSEVTVDLLAEDVRWVATK